MYGEAKKLHLIEAILKVEDDSILVEVENILSKNSIYTTSRKSFKDFAGTLSDEEIEAMEKVIEEGCEQINPDDWK
jgi:hypothetical protein